MSAADVKRVLISTGLDEAEATEVTDALAARLGIRTPQAFVGYFALMPIKDFWAMLPGYDTRGGLLASLRRTQQILERAEKEDFELDQDALDETVSNPINPKTNGALTKTWIALYGYKLPGSQEGSHQILGAMYRSLLSRRIQANVVRGMVTLESTNGLETNKKQWKLGNVRFIGEEDMKEKTDTYSIKSNPLLYLIALEAHQRTLCKAGTYYIKDPQDDRPPEDIASSPLRLNIEREPIENHLARCRSFVMEWTTREGRQANPASVLRQLTRIDLEIRRRWADLYRANNPDGITYTKCIRMTEPTADGLWNADLTREILGSEPDAGKGSGKLRQEIDKLKARIETVKKGAGKSSNSSAPKGGGKSPKGDKKKGKGKGAVTTGNKVQVKNGKWAQGAKSRGSKTYCPFYAKNSCKKPDCKMAHVCNVLTSANRVCEESHPASEHAGASI